MKILLASSEVVPYIKTGGLGDVAGTLINEYRKTGTEASAILPLYKKIKQSARDFKLISLGKEITVPLGNSLEKGSLWKGKTPEGADVYFIENRKFYDRDEIYSTSRGDYPDNASRFIFYSRGVLEALKALKLKPDIIHCNDWQTGLIPVYLKTLYKDEFPKTATLMTIHNLGYQGIFKQSEMPLTGLAPALFNINGLEFHGKINFLKAGILFADIINTVSGNYAKEILTSEYGFGLDEVLRKRRNYLYGIINGIDYSEWNPEEDNFIPAKYSKDDLSGKVICKKYLQKEHGLAVTNSPLIGMVTRLSSQKGLDIVADAMDMIIGSGVQMIILGKGDESLHRVFSGFQKKYRRNLSVTIGFDNELAHKIYAGSDIFLMPSRYEPCGLGQLIALRYSTIPVARKTGGLLDTIEEYNPSEGTGSGFLFTSYSYTELIKTVKRAKKFFNAKKHWLNLQKNAMSRNFSWPHSAKKYLSLYQKALSKNDR